MLTKKTMGKRWIKQPLSHHSMAHHLILPFPHNSSSSSSSSSFSKVAVLSTLLVLLCSLICSPANAASVIGNSNSNNNNNNNQIRNRVVVAPSSNHGPHNVHNSYRFLDRHNEYDSSSSGVSILDDDTLRLSLAIDDDSSLAAGLNAPSLHFLEPKVYLRVSGESGMLRPADYIRNDQGREESNYNLRASSKGTNARTDLQSNEDDDEHQVEHDDDFDDEDEDMNDNYHHHFPYIESYREKYVRPELNLVPITTPSPPPTQVGQASKRFKESKSSQQQQDQHVWSDIIAQVTTPSSFNEINSSASEHRLADLHFRQHLPSYFYNKYSSYSEEDLENVADLDDEHSKYFVKTRPRSVTTSGSNIYSNFYYEPPSFSTKSVPIPVKTNKAKFVFATVKPTRDPQQLYADEDDEDEDTPPYSAVVRSRLNFHDDEAYQRDVPVMMTTISPILNNFPSKTPQQHHPSYSDDDREEGDDSSISIPNRNNKTFLKASSSAGAAVSMAHYDHTNYQSQQQNASGGGSSSATNKSPLSSFDVSPSQSIQSKVTVSRPQLKSDVETTPATPSDDIAMMMTTSEKIGGGDGGVSSTEPPPTTTTDATSIPGVPGVDYPTLDEIPQTGFDCKNQRYKGFFADIDAKCQAWHYCDFTDGHSTFLCPNGTLFSQVLLTCDWWFNVDCNQAKQLYVLNERLYRYIKPPKPSFPEDFIGEHVDKWLLQQLQMGLLPKVRKKAKAKLVPLPPSPQEQPPPTPAKSN